MTIIQQVRDYEIYLDGAWHKASDTRLSLLSHTLHYGYGAFEGVRAYVTDQGPAIFRLQDHTRRLLRSAKILNLTLPQTEAELNEAQLEILRRNHLSSAYLRPLVFLGESTMSIDPSSANVHVLIVAWPWQNFHYGNDQGIKLISVPYQRQSGSLELLQAKAIGHYLVSGMALQKAREQGGHESLLLDPEGYVCEASAQNIFMIKEGKLITSASKYALAGITRATLMTLAQDLGMPVQEKLFKLEELYEAEAIFLTGTASEVVPVLSLDQQILNSHEHPWVQALQEAYRAVVHGEKLEYRQWLSFIS